MEWQSESGTKESNLCVAEERKRKADVFPDQDKAVELESFKEFAYFSSVIAYISSV